MVRTSKEIESKNLVIFCEGRSEKKYFNKIKKKYRVRNLNIIPEVSTQKNPIHIVNEAIKYMKHLKKSKNYLQKDVCYCVFDKDDNTKKQLEEALEISKESEFNIKLILSNPNLEVWFALHFEELNIDKNYSKKEIENIISSHIGKRYEKCNIGNLFDNFLKNNTKNAIKNSKQKINEFYQLDINIYSIDSNPSSMIIFIIEEIQEMSKF